MGTIKELLCYPLIILVSNPLIDWFKTWNPVLEGVTYFIQIVAALYGLYRWIKYLNQREKN